MNDQIDKSKLEGFASYADQHDIYDLFQSLVHNVLIAKPEDPLSHMIDYLRKPKTPKVVILAPPSSDCVHVNTGQLIRSAIEKKTVLGTQAKSYVEKSQLVPDNVIFNIVAAKLSDDADCVERGYVLEGFPRTQGQITLLQRKGLFPSHIVVLDVPDQVILQSAGDIRFDPNSGQDYHLKLSPPGNDKISARLVERNTNSTPILTSRLSTYRRHLASIISTITGKSNLRTFTCTNGMFGNETSLVQDILGYIGTSSPLQAPRGFRVLVSGLPGSGKSTISQLLSEKYGFIHVSAKTVCLEKSLNPDTVPESTLTDLIINRLKKQDCVDNGWVLDGFPTTESQIVQLRVAGITPNRVLYLETPQKTIIDRITQRRYDPITGRCINLLAIPADVSDTKNFVPNPVDQDTEGLRQRVKSAESTRKVLEKAYGIKTSFAGQDDEIGLVQEIQANGINKQDLSAVFERVESALMRPVPVEHLPVKS